MSRSTRRTPVFGIASAASDKPAKRESNRRFRRITREALKHDHEPPHDLNMVSDPWDFPKDGKLYWFQATARDLSK